PSNTWWTLWLCFSRWAQTTSDRLASSSMMRITAIVSARFRPLESDAERASQPRLGCGGHATAHRLDQLFGNREPKAKAPGVSRARRVRPEEALEHARQVLRCDSDPGI